MSEIKVNKVVPRVAAGNVQLGNSGDTLTVASGADLIIGGDLIIPSGGTITAQTGSVLNGVGKVANVTAWSYTSTVVQSATSPADVTGYSLDYTPADSSNTVVFTGQVQFSGIRTDQSTPEANFEFYRDGGATGIKSLLNRGRFGNTAENHQLYINVPLIGEDSPATASQVTYTLRAWTNADDIEVEYLSVILFEITP